MLTTQYDPAQNTLTFSFTGSMDTIQSAADADAIATALKNAAAKTASPLDKPLRAIFNLQEVDYVSSAFFRICLSTAKQVRKGNFAVINVRPAVTQLLKIAGMDEFIEAL